MLLKLALGVRGTVAWHRLGALEGGGGYAPPPPLPMHPWGGAVSLMNLLSISQNSPQFRLQTASFLLPFADSAVCIISLSHGSEPSSKLCQPPPPPPSQRVAEDEVVPTKGPRGAEGVAQGACLPVRLGTAPAGRP